MSTINYNDNTTEDIIEDYSEPNDISTPTYPMYYCPLCRYSMPMADEYTEYENPDEYEYDEDDDFDPGYRQRRPIRRRRRRRRRRRHPYYPMPYYPRPHYPRPYYPRPYYPRPHYPMPYHRLMCEDECDED